MTTIFEKRSQRSYDKKADTYEETFDGRFTRKFKDLLVRVVAIPEGGKLLDVACGNGRLLNMLSERIQFSGYGTDISEKMVKNASRLNPSMVFEPAGCDALPFENDTFDVLTVCAAFHHFPDVERFAQEARRVLKPGGKVYIAEVFVPTLLRVLFNPFLKISRDGDVKFYAPDEIKNLFTKAGFAEENFVIEGRVQIIGVRKSAVMV